MRALDLSPGAFVRFSEPQTVTVEASWDTIRADALDTWEDEQYNYVYDVVSVECGWHEIVLTTCRTIARPDRPVYAIPRSAIHAAYVRDGVIS